MDRKMKTRTTGIGIISLMVTLLAFSTISCKKDSTLYNNLTMGNVIDGRFVSDQGNIFNIIEQTCGGRIDTMKRAIVVCDILNVTKGTANEYDVRLNQLSKVLTKKPVHIDEAQGDIERRDPLNVSEVWYSGGYLNLCIQIPIKPGSKTRHLINLVYEKNDDGSLAFDIRHNAFGDIMEGNSGAISFIGSYVSFPIKEIIDKDSDDIVITWKWYEPLQSGYGWNGIEKEYKIEFQ